MSMKKFYVMYSKNLQNKETTIEAYGKMHAERVFKELYGNLHIIQLREINK
jgi:hypothetical protein